MDSYKLYTFTDENMIIKFMNYTERPNNNLVIQIYYNKNYDIDKDIRLNNFFSKFPINPIALNRTYGISPEYTHYTIEYTLINNEKYTNDEILDIIDEVFN